MDALVAGFSLDHIGRSPARYDVVQRDHWQKEAVAHLPMSEFIPWANLNTQALSSTEQNQWAELLQTNVLLPADVAEWQACLGVAAPDYSEEAVFVLRAGVAVIDVLADALQSGLTGAACLDAIKQRSGLKGKALFMPLRRLLTGREDGPELLKLLACLSTEALQNRITVAKQRIQ